MVAPLRWPGHSERIFNELTEGPAEVGGGSGVWRRVASGKCQPVLWTPSICMSHTACHAVLSLVELVEQICTFVLPRPRKLGFERRSPKEEEKEQKERKIGRQTLRQLALVNRFLSHVATKLLWRELETLNDLLALIPGTRDQDGVTLTDFLPQTFQGDIFMRYRLFAKHVHQLIIDDADAEIEPVSSTPSPIQYPPDEFFLPMNLQLTSYFPSLRRVQFPITRLVKNGHLTPYQFKHLVNPSLEELVIYWHRDYTAAGLPSFSFFLPTFIEMAAITSHLRSLTILRVPLYLQDIEGLSSHLLPDLKRLTDLTVWVGSDAVGSIFKHLDASRSLRVARLTIQNWRPSCSYTNDVVANSNLTALELVSYNPGEIFNCLSTWPSNPYLTELGCGIFYTPVASLVARLIDALITYAPVQKITKFTFCDHYVELTPEIIASRNLREYIFNSSYLEPLLRLENVTCIDVNIFSEVVVSSQMMAMMKSAWPMLEYIFLAPFTVMVDVEESERGKVASLVDLVEFAAAHPKLHTCGIRIDARRPKLEEDEPDLAVAPTIGTSASQVPILMIRNT